MGYQLKDPTEGMELNLKKDKPEEKSGVSGMLAGILGMGSAIGGMIPSLRKGPQTGQLEKMQRGQGAGASLARQTASRAAAAVTGASTAQPSSGRGGNLREGLRAADQIVQRGAQQASITGARESLAATQMLRGNDLRRRDAFKTLGAGVGQGLAGIGGVLAAARDQGAPQETGEQDAAQTLQAEMEYLQDPATGLRTPMTEQQRVIESGQQGLDSLTAARQQALPAGPTQEQGGPELRKQAGQPQAQAGQPAMSEQDVRAQQIANLQAVNEQAAQDYISSAGTPEEQRKLKGLKLGEQTELPPSMGWPEYTQEYLYNLADNYAPMINQGMDPQEVAKLLIKYELFPIDWMRLGITEFNVEKVPR